MGTLVGTPIRAPDVHVSGHVSGPLILVGVVGTLVGTVWEIPGPRRVLRTSRPGPWPDRVGRTGKGPMAAGADWRGGERRLGVGRYERWG